MTAAELLVADIGGTGSRLALMQGGRLISTPVIYSNSDYESAEAILDNFLADTDHVPERAALAVAGPVQNNRVQMTNLGWELSGKKLAECLGLKQVELVNDFEALAWSTLILGETDLLQLGRGVALPLGTRGILGPGTGLGVSGLAHNAGTWAAIAGEGGHVTLAAGSKQEAALIEQVSLDFGHCSAERLLSGSGLALIYKYSAGSHATPEDITRRALAGETAALETVEIFSSMLGTVASNLALTFGAKGGIYLAGGILPAICGLFANSGFRDRFEAKGRFTDYLAAIPTYLITSAYPSFKGLDLYINRLVAGKRLD